MKPVHRDGTITSLRVLDVRFPTSRHLDGSDAMNLDPDYSAAYVIIGTDRGDGIEGHGLTFTIGRGTEVVVAGVEALRPLVVGQPLARVHRGARRVRHHLTAGDSQLRWLGPEKGVMQLATAAVVNALWDLWAKLERQAALEAARRSEPGADRRAGRLALSDRRADARGGPARARSPGADARRARGGAARDRLPGLHDVGRLARLLRRQDPPALPRGAGRRLHPLQDQGGRQPGRRCPARGAGPRGDRPGRRADGRRQPALGRRRRRSSG